MTQFLHNLYIFMTTGISGRHRFVINKKEDQKMKPIFVTIIIAAVLIAGNITTSSAQSPEQLYQKGLLKEEGEGALQEAINLFNQVADNSKADKSLQAKALLHVGLCFEKLGNQEAVKAYKKLVSNFPGQKNEVAIARERLSKLITTGSSKEIAIRQVWAGKGVDQLGSVSADGEHLTFVDWETGNLAIRNLKTGENKPLTTEGSWKEPRQYALFSLISPDATQVVCMWYNAEGNTDLRLIKIGNPSPVILFTPTNKDEAMAPCAWYSDGKRIIVQMYNGDSKIWKLLSINVFTKEIQILKEKHPGPSNLSRVSLSPDEKLIAFDFPNPDDKDLYDIYLLSIDSKAESTLIKHPANDRLIGWLPGRNELLFTSDRTGTNDVWAVNTSDVKSFDLPERILTSVGEINPMGFKFDGSFYYGVLSHIFESFILTLDSITNKLSDSPRKVLSTPVFDIFWLSDGETLICKQFDQNWNFTLGTYNSKTGVIQTLAGNIIARGSQRISPDGKSVLIFGFDKQKRSEENDYGGGIYSVDIKSGKNLEILRFKKNDVQHSNSVEWDKEGKSIFYTSDNHIVKRNIETGEEKILYTDINLFFNPVLRRSFDGKSLLLDGTTDLDKAGKLNEGETYLLSVPEDGGEARILCNAIFPGSGIYKKISLSPDGKYIYFSAKTQAITSVLYRIPAAGGSPEIVWQSKDYNIAGISIHPDGKRIALSTSVSQVEIRAIENLGNEVIKVFSDDE